MLTAVAIPQVSVLELNGHLNAANAGELQSRLTKAVASSTHESVLVDMENVDSLDSAGLMALVSALTLAQKLNRRFSLCGVAPAIAIIFELTQLDRVFEIFENRASFEASLA
ncbi:STAS domain-containing protein [Oxynema sp. CENA135]|jgi:anti-anti-sigma factor|uniref:STAS domain-containing protein n=1 Tax=Oxynema sp. CENA135 TaxID=984206 RepID=UPI00190C6DC5|nr:STAS domain-containing protein [Oxynema sp. CENA135]MBK4728623.1 STAS domain-containing protein [Oxynema sp. CENA135]